MSAALANPIPAPPKAIAAKAAAKGRCKMLRMVLPLSIRDADATTRALDSLEAAKLERQKGIYS
jgi:hypothetical protein